jgi:hypothetical protein
MPQEAAWNWHTHTAPVRGSNYLPRTAVNVTEMWQRETFDPATINQELAWAEAAGYNSLRVFLQYLVWRDDPAGLRARLDQFLDIASNHGMRVMLIPFCDCSFSGREPYLGPQDDPITGVHNSGWVPSPGLARVTDRRAWPDLKRYIQDLVGHYGQDERVLIWDLYNEPGNSNMGAKSLPLVEATVQWAREADPAQPLTVGLWTDLQGSMSRRLAELSDVVSFHAYGDPQDVAATIEVCHSYGRPLICTEWLRRQAGNTFAAVLPLFRQHKIGWYHWGLVAGKTQTYMPWGSQPGDPIPDLWQHDVFHPDGRPYDADEIELVREFTY